MEEKNNRDSFPKQGTDTSSKLNKEGQAHTVRGEERSSGPSSEAFSEKTISDKNGTGDRADEYSGEGLELFPEKTMSDKNGTGNRFDEYSGEGLDFALSDYFESLESDDSEEDIDPDSFTASFLAADDFEEDEAGTDLPGAIHSRSGGFSKRENADNSLRSEQTGQPDQTDQSGWASRREQTGQSEQSGKSEDDRITPTDAQDARNTQTALDARNTQDALDAQDAQTARTEGEQTARTEDQQSAGELENTLEKVRSDKKKASPKKATASYEEKLIRHKKRLYRRTLFLVALVTILLTAGIFLWMHRGYKKAELTRVATFTVEDGAEFVSLGRNIVRYSGSGAVCMDRRGNARWNVSYDMQQPITSVSGDVLAIANRSGYNVYVMNTKGLMGTIETMFPIHSIAASESGEVAVVMNDAKATWIRLYTAKGQEIAYIIQTMPENGYPISAAVSADGETLCLSSVQLSSAAVKSNISFYNFGKEGQKETDHRVDSYDFIDEVVPYVGYMDDETCAGISDKRLILFQKTILGKSGSSSILFSENLQGVFSGENLIGLLFNNTSGEEQYRLDVYNRRGKKAGSVSFTMQYKDIKISGDKVYINNEQECQIFTLGGRRLFKGELGHTISALIPGTRLSDLLVVTEGEIESVRLH